MRSFKDSKGRLWEVNVTVGACKRARGLVGVDLYKLVDDGCKPLGELLGDPCRLVDVLFVLCKDQADKEGVTDEDFGSSLGGDSLEAAADAFVEALLDFFPSRKGRETMRKLTGKAKEVAGLLTEKAEMEVGNIDPRQAAEAWIRSHTNSAAAAASTPTP